MLPTRSSSTVTPADRPGSLSALICVVDEQRYAIPLADVVEVTRAAALTTPSGAASMLVGYIDLRGDILHVLGARELLALPSRSLGLTDRFVVVQTGPRCAAIVVDRVDGVEDVGLVTGSGADRRDGLAVARRARAAEGDELVALIDLDQLLASSAVDRAGMTAS